MVSEGSVHGLTDSTAETLWQKQAVEKGNGTRKEVTADQIRYPRLCPHVPQCALLISSPGSPHANPVNSVSTCADVSTAVDNEASLFQSQFSLVSTGDCSTLA